MDLFAMTMSGAAFGGEAEPSGVRQALSDPDGDLRLADRVIGEALKRHQHTWPEADGPRYALIGRGGATQVWTATDNTLMRSVTIKALANGRTRPDHIATFIAEARLTALLNHPNIPPVHDLVVSEQGQPCFIMKAVEGMTLGAALRQATTGETPSILATTHGILSTFLAIGQALSYAHHQGIFHQDVKPDNILVGRFGEVLLLDWGCARHRDDAELKLFGTPYYMSPEQARRETSDEISDVYCFGASLFHALIRRPPLATRAEATFWDLKRRGMIDLPSQSESARVPAPLLAIVLKAIHANRSKRYQSMDALLADLNAYQAGLAVAAHRDSLVHAWARWSYRHRSALIALLVIAVGLAGAAIAIAQERARERARWRPLASDSFSGGNEAVAKHWIIKRSSLTPTWSAQPFIEEAAGGEAAGVVNGRLEIGRFANVVNAVWRDGLAGDLRIEWTCTPLVNSLNLNCFLGETRRSGISLQVGSWGDARYAAIFRNDTEMVDYQYIENPVAAGQSCTFIMERENGRVRLALNGEWILHLDDIESGDAMAPVQFGFDAYNESRLAIDDVRVFARPLPERISPVAVGGRLFRLGLIKEALQQFQELALLRAQEPVGIEADFHAAVCLARLDDPGADAALAAFIAANPDHALVPHAIFERYLIAEKAGDRPAIEARCRDMATQPDLRMRKRLASRIGSETHISLRQRGADSYASLTVRQAFIDHLIGEARRIHELARVLDVRLLRHGTLERIVEHLRACGHSRIGLDLCPPEAPERIKCLIDLARLDEASAISQHVLNEKALVQETLGQFQDMTLSQRHRPKLQGWYRLGDHQALTREDPFGDLLGNALIDRGEMISEIAADPRWPDLVRARAWAVQGDWVTIATCKNASPAQQVEALCRIGRGDEAVHRFRWDTSSLGIIAAYRLHHGDVAGCRSLVEEMEATPPNHVRRSSLLGHYLTPVILRARMKDPDPAERLRNPADWQREIFSNRYAVMAAYITGSADEATFRRQPASLCLESLLHYSNALRAEIAGDTETARAGWKALLATPSSQLLEADMLHPLLSILAEEPRPKP